MITVAEADHFISQHVREFGTERISFEESLGKMLAEDIFNDRDLPPFNRATMDGIAIPYEVFKQGISSFNIINVQAAGEEPVISANEGECSEIMTGAPVPDCFDTVIPYEHLLIENGIAKIRENNIVQGQNIHKIGVDKKRGELLVAANHVITPAIIGILATVGKVVVQVKRYPKIVIISTGNEVIDVHLSPEPYQIRRSNSYTIYAALKQLNLEAEMLHLPDDLYIIKSQLQHCIQTFDVMILTGGVSMGRFDFVPKALEELSVHQVFHKVQQRPGKPFWFGKNKNEKMFFAFPGNPVSTFLCLLRYFIPWLQQSLGMKAHKVFAQLSEDVQFRADLQYFLQVKLELDEHGSLIAIPVAGNGSGDFYNLLNTDAFMELPREKDLFKKGERYQVWPYNSLIMKMDSL